MPHAAKADPLFEAVKQLVIDTRTPSIALVQRTFRLNYGRAASMLEAMEAMEAMEGEIVTPRDERGMRRMLAGETVEYL
jgi:DNA segregation ATPase FtsK/SpoIIIE-like protein